MSKLPKQHQFTDLSDYGRPVAVWIAKRLLNTKLTAIHVTIGFIIAGLLAIFAMLNHWYVLAAVLLVLKSILDAADGTLARMRNTPSYVGRYFDSVSDIILNFLILSAVGHLVNANFIFVLLAFVGMQLQGTLYNYYYVIMRNNLNGDSTSRIFETNTPTALAGEKQSQVDFFFRLYILLYGIFDKIIYRLDPKAANQEYFPTWFMTLVSTFGLGFQLLIIGALLVLNLPTFILPFFMAYTVFIVVFIGLRILLNKNKGAEVNLN